MTPPIEPPHGEHSAPLHTSRRRQATVGTCPFCERKLSLTFHHLIPRKLHRRPRFKRHFTREELARGVYCCRPCHNAIHDTYTEMELGTHFADVASLLSDEALKRRFDWLARQRRAVAGR